MRRIRASDINYTLPELFSRRCEVGFPQHGHCCMTSGNINAYTVNHGQPVSDPLLVQETPCCLRCWLPLVLVVCLMIAAYVLGVQDHLTLQKIATNREELRLFIASNLALALLIYMAIYVSVVALSIPGTFLLTIAGGLLFGWILGSIATVFAATAGSSLIFFAAKTSLESILARKSGPIIARIQAGFARDAFHYLLFLRLVPLVPFWLVNIAAALAQIRLKTFVAATFLGIMPATIAFSFVGSGLDSVIDAQKSAYDTCLLQGYASACKFELSFTSIITPQLLLALAALGGVALIPVAIKKLKGKT